MENMNNQPLDCSMHVISKLDWQWTIYLSSLLFFHFHTEILVYLFSLNNKLKTAFDYYISFHRTDGSKISDY